MRDSEFCAIAALGCLVIGGIHAALFVAFTALQICGVLS
jgi:hypothetical protein